MPYIKLEGCGECPHVGFRDSNGLDAECRIVCNHLDQESEEVVTAKIRSVKDNIYFKCPLIDYGEE